MEMEIVILSEVTQVQEDMFYVICHVWVLALKFLIVVHIEVGKLV